jgi:glucose-6-phosphate 1-epimerase
MLFMSVDLAALRRFEIPHLVTVEKTSTGLHVLLIRSPEAQADIFLHGAHVTHFQPDGSAPVLFLSEASHFEPGKPIRGGIPVIFPWFGGLAGQPEAPAHGFARTQSWELCSVTRVENQVEVCLALQATPESRALWPHEFELHARIRVGKQLRWELEVYNPSTISWSFEEALHTYFAVNDVQQVRVKGLAETEYLDKTDAFSRNRQDAEPIGIHGETDRIYIDTLSTCVVEDPAATRALTVSKSGSKTTVLWNPWIAKAKAMADFGDEEWPEMLCVETANAGENSLTLGPGERHQMTCTLSAAPLP